MKRALQTAASIILSLVLIFVAVPFNAGAAAQYRNAKNLRWVTGSDKSLKVTWDLDYSDLPSDVTVSGVLHFYKGTYSYDKGLFNLRFSGKANEIDLTDYAWWYFGDEDAWYYFTLSLTYKAADGSVTNMSSVSSADLTNNAFITPAPNIVDVEIDNLREGYDNLDIDIHWMNMKSGYKLEIILSINGRKTLGMEAMPDRSFFPEDICRVTLKPSADLPFVLKQGDIVGIEVQIMYDDDKIGEPVTYETAVLPKTVRRDNSDLTLVAICNPDGARKTFELPAGADEEAWSAAFNEACRWMGSLGANTDKVKYGAVYAEEHYYVNGQETDKAAYIAAGDGSAQTLESDVTCVRYVYNMLPAVLGDADRNGRVDTDDATWLQRYVGGVRTPYTQSDFVYGDADLSGQIELTDVTMIQMYIAGMDIDYPIGKRI